MVLKEKVLKNMSELVSVSGQAEVVMKEQDYLEIATLTHNDI